ncbi:CocE/NonD family hydrolase [Synechococcus sp. BSF8S]|uniref:CocE/NonD family hydrolase n=1 Tax=Synechococcales TaxID=1890424 RepID=UPI00162480DA|nr:MULTISPECIES: CocE/NonD family hydrolase [unclassified Synechococcus]MBC1260116.1 CocE/NonD family hydrolase [Synechococcus sp. BSF8S]MBC1263067.1 CocE/NonD family hydrolase [Synechococcus sp. BSA11S]
MPCPDGVLLATRVWKPTQPGRWPLLLMRQPYGRAIASTVTYAHPRWYASQGYAVAVQDVRGRGASQGEFRGFAQEAADGGLALAWARTLPYANGRVGTYGFSYQGLSQLLLSPGSPLPDALAPAMAGLDERLHWASEGGAHWWGLGLGWALQLAAETMRRAGDPSAWHRIRRSLQDGTFPTDGLALLECHDPGGMGLGWLRLDPGQPQGWRRHEPPEALFRQPMLLVGGWHDPHLSGVLDLLARGRAAGADPWVRIGAWSHLNWSGGLDRLQLSFFDRHLRGREGLEVHPKEAIADLGSGQWQGLSDAGSGRRDWALASGGLAAIDADEGRLLADGDGGGALWFVHDPWRPVPGRGGHLGLDAGLVARTDLDARSDVACFTTAPLDEPLQLAGRPELELEICADQDGFDLCGALSVIRRGTSWQLSTGVARFLGPHCRRRQRRRLSLQPLVATISAGERLRLSLAASAWPQVAVNPGTGECPLGPVGPAHRVITLELHLADAHLRLLPLDPGAD